MPARSFEGPIFDEQGGFLDARRAQGSLFGDHAFQLNTWLTAAGRPVRWPVQVGRPPLQASAFQRRDHLRSGIADRLGRGNSVTRAGVILVGDGGVGKTQLAAAAFRGAHEGGTELRVWVDASSRASAVAAYTQANTAIDPTATAEDVETAAARFLDWLAVTDKTWLVVLDDVADPADVRGLWPTGPAGSVVATTRRRDLAPADAEHVEVDVFTATEAYGYLANRLAGTPANAAAPDALAHAEELAEAVDGLPVALAQAAAVILNEGITCTRYLERLGDRAASLAELFPDDAPADEYGYAVAATWSLAIDRANALAPAGLARQALLIAAVVDPNGAPEELWATNPVLEMATAELEEDQPATPAQMRSALRNLHRLSLITHDPAGGPLAVRTHALVQRATLDPFATEDVHRIVRTTADAVMEIWPDSKRDPALSQVFHRTTATLAGRVPDGLWRPNAHELLFRAGDAEMALDEARSYWADLAATATRVLGVEHADTLRAKRKLLYWQGTGDMHSEVRAVADMEELLTDHIRLLGTDDPNTLDARATLANLRGWAGDPSRAATETEQVLEDHLRVLGPDDHRIFRLQADLAWWHGRTGDTGAAITTLEQSLADRVRLTGPDHPDTLATRYELTRWREMVGDGAQAVAEMEQVLADYVRMRRDDDLDVLRMRLALVQTRANVDIATAVADTKKILADCERVTGPMGPRTLDARFVLGYLQGEAGDPSRAVADMEAVLADYRNVFGSTHRNTLWTRYHVARWRGKAGDPTGAVAELDELLADYKLLTGGRSDFEKLTFQLERAYWRGKAGDPPGAAAELEDLLAKHQHDLGPHHRARARAELANLRAKAGGDPAAAVQELTQLLDDHQQTDGPNPYLTLKVRRYIANWRAEAGDPTRAVEELKALLPEHQRLMGPNNYFTLEIQDELAHWRQIVADTISGED